MHEVVQNNQIFTCPTVQHHLVHSRAPKAFLWVRNVFICTGESVPRQNDVWLNILRRVYIPRTLRGINKAHWDKCASLSSMISRRGLLTSTANTTRYLGESWIACLSQLAVAATQQLANQHTDLLKASTRQNINFIGSFYIADYVQWQLADFMNENRAKRMPSRFISDNPWC